MMSRMSKIIMGCTGFSTSYENQGTKLDRQINCDCILAQRNQWNLLKWNCLTIAHYWMDLDLIWVDLSLTIKSKSTNS
jgi:hypothetical protein